MGKTNKIAPHTENAEIEAVEGTIEEQDIKRREEWTLAAGKFGYGLGEYNKDRFVTEARMYYRQSAEAMFEAGRRLALLRAREPHGSFLSCVEEIGISKSYAYMLINAADKFLDEHGKLGLSQKGRPLSFINLQTYKIPW